MNGREQRETVWKRTTYKIAADINFTAIFRVGSTVLLGIVVSLIAYFGNRQIVAEDLIRTDMIAIGKDVVGIKGDVATLRTDQNNTDIAARILGNQVSTNELDIRELKTKLYFITKR